MSTAQPMTDPDLEDARACAGPADAAEAIRRATDRAAEKLVVLRSRLASREAEIEALRDVAEERRRLIDELGSHAVEYRTAAEQRAELIAGLDAELHRLRAELDRTTERLAQVTAATEAANAKARASRHEADGLRKDVSRLRDALDARTALANELETACAERLTLIEQLSEEVAVLREAADQRADLLERNEERFRRMQAELHADQADDGVAWRALAEERERALHDLATEADRRAVLLAELTAALEGRTREVEDLRKRLTRAS